MPSLARNSWTLAAVRVAGLTPPPRFGRRRSQAINASRRTLVCPGPGLTLSTDGCPDCGGGGGEGGGGGAGGGFPTAGAIVKPSKPTVIGAGAPLDAAIIKPRP